MKHTRTDQRNGGKSYRRKGYNLVTKQYGHAPCSNIVVAAPLVLALVISKRSGIDESGERQQSGVDSTVRHTSSTSSLFFRPACVSSNRQHALTRAGRATTTGTTSVKRARAIEGNKRRWQGGEGKERRKFERGLLRAWKRSSEGDSAWNVLDAWLQGDKIKIFSNLSILSFLSREERKRREPNSFKDYPLGLRFLEFLVGIS